MIETIWMDTTGLEKAETLEKMMPYLSEERKKRLKALKNPAAVRLSAGAGLLLYFALEKNGLQNRLEEIRSGSYGKPFLPDSSFFFNLSHSGSIALCAFGDIALGADVQQVKEAVPRKTAKILSAEETLYLQGKEGRGQANAFYKVWSKKESLVKWDGRGLRLPLNAFSVVQNGRPVEEIIWEGKPLFFKSYCLPGCVASICAEQPFFPEQATEIMTKILNNY